METYLSRQHVCRIADASGVAAARRVGAKLAAEAAFDDVSAGQLAIVITEAATNILKHAGTGEILLRRIAFNALKESSSPSVSHGIEVVAIDSGPGITNIALQLEDGQSSADTYGGGLGAMVRLGQTFEIYTRPQLGTVLMVEVWQDGGLPATGLWDVGAVCLPLHGETMNGDDWSFCESHDNLALMVADGLGHGPLAAEASQRATQVFLQHCDRSPAEVLRRSHDALRGTRGAAVIALNIDAVAQEVGLCGIGNVAVVVQDPARRHHLVSLPGIVGSNINSLRPFSVPWSQDSVLIAHSDGINTRWDLDSYPDLPGCHPSLIAAVLYRDFARSRDDSSVVVVRQRRSVT